MTITMKKADILTTDNLYALIQGQGTKIKIELSNEEASLHITEIDKADVLTALLADDDGCETLTDMVTAVFTRTMPNEVAEAVGNAVAQVILENCFVNEDERDTEIYNYTYDEGEQAWWCAQHGIDNIDVQFAIVDVQ